MIRARKQSSLIERKHQLFAKRLKCTQRVNHDTKTSPTFFLRTVSPLAQLGDGQKVAVSHSSASKSLFFFPIRSMSVASATRVRCMRANILRLFQKGFLKKYKKF